MQRRHMARPPTSIEDHYRRQLLRFCEYEHHRRNEIVGAEAAIRHAELAIPFYEVLNASATLAPLLREERTARGDLARLAQMSLQAATRSTRKALVDAQLSIEPVREESVRDDLCRAESVERESLSRNNLGLSATKALRELEDAEKRWRLQILLELRKERSTISAEVTQQRIVWLITPKGTSSEVHYRRFLEVKESLGRKVLAIEFCKLNWMWLEEWQRMTLMFLRKMQLEWLKSRQKMQRQEQTEWEEIVLVSRPVVEDILEQVDFRRQRQERRQRKIESLKQLRHVEVERLARQRRQGDSYVQAWRVRELQAIEEIHKELLQDVASFGSDRELFREIAEHHNATMDVLSKPTTSFTDLKNYRLRLLGFDRLINQVEADETPMLSMRTKPLAIEDKRRLAFIGYQLDEAAPEGSIQHGLLMLADNPATATAADPRDASPDPLSPPRSVFEGYRRWHAANLAAEKSQSKSTQLERDSASRSNSHMDSQGRMLRAIDRIASSIDRRDLVDQVDAHEPSSAISLDGHNSDELDELSRRRRKVALERETQRQAARLYDDPELDKLQKWLQNCI